VTRHSRRRFLRSSLALAGLGLLAGCGRLPFQPQQTRLSRVGILSARTPADGAPVLDAFRGGLRDLGYVEGRDIVLEPRFAEGISERYPELAAELVQLNVSIIVANEPNAVLAARRASDTIPIVMAGASEVPVERGLVASLARPGGTVTGLTQGTPTLPTKRLQLLKDTVPDLARVAFINDPAISPIEANPKVGGLRAAAEALGLRLEVVDLPAPEEFEALFADLVRKQVGAFFPDGSPVSLAHRFRLSELAIRHRLPWIGQGSQYKDAALLAYGANILDVWRRVATHVDKLLKGASPADLPVEQPTKFDFVVNLKIARALGLTIPQEVLMQATEVIQ
jgi:putative tryptophan/tyrosine transport system substrate-binding protein